MENRKGSGIFLGIVSIATLIVAIIGATFAYFSASTESNEGAVGLEAYEYKMSLKVEKVYPVEPAALIPLNPSTKIKRTDGKYIKYDENGDIVATDSADDNVITNVIYAVNEAKNKCIDDNGMQVCAIYKVTITNESGNEVTLTGELETTSNIASSKPERTPFKNLAYQELTGTPENGFAIALDGDGRAKAPVTLATDVGGSIRLGNIKVYGGTTVDGVFTPGIGVGYILIYLNDIGADQGSEMGASMTGKLKYSTEGGLGSTLTGSFTVSGEPDPEPEPDPVPDDPTE